MEFNARIYSRLGQSGSIFGISLLEQIKHYPIKVLSSDMSVVAGLERFKSLHPDCFYNIGIAEQNLIGLSAGLTAESFKCIAVAQAAFISMRSFEQIRQYMGYMHYNIIVIGISSGFTLTFFGNTHYAIEDLSLMRGIPNMTVLSPADAGEAVKAFEQALSIESPVYIRLTGGLNHPIVYNNNFQYEIGQSSIVFEEGEEVTILATGSMVYQSIKAAEILRESRVLVRVIDMHTIKPLDYNIINGCIVSRLIVSVEEHTIIGGLGGAIAEYISNIKNFPVLYRLGVQDCFLQTGDYQYLLFQSRLTPALIAEDILKKLKDL
jgi:transketolase